MGELPLVAASGSIALGPAPSSLLFVGSFSLGFQWPIEKTFTPFPGPQKKLLFYIQAKVFLLPCVQNILAF
jgi:hypothetical protein